ncbi:hypothetical protein EVAR_53939_1 [Eumeta japonica]|uniref:Uncharacterized protein n=1 Tax=Eumeta variegata TaxID=151549 RepID=A0A4C1ZEW0_EUMVA|nr:hypothetical protein EVAR_53939_1 [Eumeta japonica]
MRRKCSYDGTAPLDGGVEETRGEKSQRSTFSELDRKWELEFLSNRKKRSKIRRKLVVITPLLEHILSQSLQFVLRTKTALREPSAVGGHIRPSSSNTSVEISKVLKFIEGELYLQNQHQHHDIDRCVNVKNTLVLISSLGLSTGHNWHLKNLANCEHRRRRSKNNCT